MFKKQGASSKPQFYFPRDRYIISHEKYYIFMADKSKKPLNAEFVQKPETSEEEAKSIAERWISENILKKKETFRFGKAVLVYYPFWRFLREDGNELKIICRPACGTLLSDIQTLSPKSEPVPIADEKILPSTINASYYYSSLYGIPRGEMLVGIPFWLISYKYQNSIYMLKIDAESGTVIPEWHAFKDPMNWVKIALMAFLPIMIISLLAVLFHPAIFIAGAIYLIILLCYSKMLAILNTKREEGKDGA